MRNAPTQIHDWEDYADREFRGLSAANARFHDIAFTDCTFRRCTFTGTEFADCSFTNCTFTACDLSLVRLTGTRLTDVQFVESKLLGVRWGDAAIALRLPLSVAFERSLLSDAIFADLNLRDLRMTDCVARGADFESADLTDAVLTGTDLSGARFLDTTLVGADLRGATGYAIDPLQNRLRRAKFSLPDAVALLAGLGIDVE